MSNYKRIFINGYSYFITVVTHQRHPILVDNIELLRESFRVSKSKFVYTIEAIVILPDHFHMIITPEDVKEYPKIIQGIKYHFSRYIEPKYYEALEQSNSRDKRGLKPIWQKRYYEHTIRDEKDFREKLQYMYHNPVKHHHVDSAKDWKYSSFAFHAKTD